MSSNSFRVLLIDDSEPFRRQVGGALAASGLAVSEASEGIEALWRARTEGVFDLVLVDIHMPKLDGLSFIRDVRKLRGYAEIPIVVAVVRMHLGAVLQGVRQAAPVARSASCFVRRLQWVVAQRRNCPCADGITALASGARGV